jgi:hypothetical protein
MLVSRESGRAVGYPIHRDTGPCGWGRSRCGDEELVEPVDEAWRRSDEVPGTGHDQPSSIEGPGERVANPLQPWGVTARGHQRGDARAPYQLQRRAGLARQAAPVGATNSAGDPVRKRPVIHLGRSGETKELAKDGRLRRQSLGKPRSPYAPGALPLGHGNQVVQRRLDQRKRAHPRVPARAGEQRPQDPV